MKKLLPLLLLLALLLSACSSSAAPASETGSGEKNADPDRADHTVIAFKGAEVQITGGGARDQGSAVVISAGGTYEVSGVSSEKVLIVDTGDDPMDVTLILNNLDLTGQAEPAIHVKQAKHFRLRLAAGSDNRLISGSEESLQNLDPEASGAALYCADDMDIEGEGSLTVCGYLNNGIACKKDLDINGGSITVLAANNGVKGNNSVQIKGGVIKISAWGDGIKSTRLDKEGKGFVEISGGQVTVDSWSDGIQAATELRLTGGSLSVTTKGDGVQASSKALKAGSHILISDGSIVLNTLEDGVRCSEGSVDISGGTLDILALGDGVLAGEKDSGLGDITVSGGSLSISAGKQALKARGSFLVSGGSIQALSGSEKQAAPVGSPFLLCLLAGPEGDSLQIGSLAQLSARQSYKSLLFVSPELSPGQEIPVTGRTGSVTGKVQ